MKLFTKCHQKYGKRVLISWSHWLAGCVFKIKTYFYLVSISSIKETLSLIHFSFRRGLRRTVVMMMRKMMKMTMMKFLKISSLQSGWLMFTHVKPHMYPRWVMKSFTSAKDMSSMCMLSKRTMFIMLILTKINHGIKFLISGWAIFYDAWSKLGNWSICSDIILLEVLAIWTVPDVFILKLKYDFCSFFFMATCYLIYYYY